jgi:hypothetical protein
MGMVSAACNSILGFGSYTVEKDAGMAPEAGGADTQAENATVEGGAGDACAAPTDRPSFESACTGAQCTPFDNSRVPLVDGGLRPLPPVPIPDAAPEAAVDPDAGDDGGGAGDGAVANDGGAVDESGAGEAGGPILCSSLPHPVYATGSSALQKLLARVGGLLGADPNAPVTFVYLTSASCTGVSAILDDAPISGIAQYFDQSGSPLTCTLPPNQLVDVGISDVFATTCRSLANGLPPEVKENFGPVQIMTFAVPQASQQKSISLEAAYNVFGFGNDSQVAPWTNANYIFERTPSSGTQNMIASTIGVPAARWQGVTNSSSANVVQGLTSAGQDPDPAVADRAIGILSDDYVGESLTTLRALAFQDLGQPCGYWPDSTATAKDKANVRDGHYPIWGPSHFYSRVDGSGAPRNTDAQKFIDSLSGVTPVGGFDLLQLYVQSFVVPICAMHVTRTSDGGNYIPYTPPATCNCYFDAQATGQTSCTTCLASSDCPVTAPVCRMFGNPPTGYCELQ